VKETLPAEAAGVVIPKGLFDFVGMMVLIALVFPMSFFRGWAIHCFYAWFLVPCGARTLSYLHCVGLSMALAFLSSALCPKPTNTPTPSIGDTFKEIPRSIAGVSLLVLLAWLMHLLIGPSL
jgi:hypothetical protein